ncbi:MAG: DUF1003 domain-containing protein [Saprospiraceae bacterium]|nr:DUF1003 domain-containing protein [Saprospiraceae bacterium]MCB9344809.1 DUF1003 domain-containing protein [Lewinellaceae bacterium]
MKKETCFITKQQHSMGELATGSSLKPQILSLIQKDHPDFSADKFISIEIVNQYRKKYLESILVAENIELNELEKEVIKAIQGNNLLSANIEEEIASDLSFGQKMADKIATFGGSWTFIITFFSFLVVWMLINVLFLASKPFDPYPFILLNLILSCLAAIQAPIIMMSQNRQEQKDRARSENDYKVNLKAELEIQLLHEKLDHMLIHQNKRLLEIQELQLDYLEEITKLNEKAKK